MANDEDGLEGRVISALSGADEILHKGGSKGYIDLVMDCAASSSGRCYLSNADNSIKAAETEWSKDKSSQNVTAALIKGYEHVREALVKSAYYPSNKREFDILIQTYKKREKELKCIMKKDIGCNRRKLNPSPSPRKLQSMANKP